MIEAIDEGNALYEIISRKGAKIGEAQNVKKSRLVHGQELLPEDPCCRCVVHLDNEEFVKGAFIKDLPVLK